VILWDTHKTDKQSEKTVTTSNEVDENTEMTKVQMCNDRQQSHPQQQQQQHCKKITQFTVTNANIRYARVQSGTLSDAVRYYSWQIQKMPFNILQPVINGPGMPICKVNMKVVDDQSKIHVIL